MIPELSILIPHKPGPSNDKALWLALDSIFQYTEMSYEIILNNVTPGDPYVFWNQAAWQAKGRTLIMTNSDVIFAPGWDVMATYAVPNVIVTGYIVEPGNLGVAPVNLRGNYGKHPDQYDEAGFHWFIKQHKAEEIKEERGWYMPCAMDKLWFRSTDMFPTEVAFPNPNDILFWESCKDALGTKFMRARSYSYHFQNQSARD